MSNNTVQSVSVAPRPAEMEIEIRGNRPHIGKSFIAEIINRALKEHGLDVKVVSQDNDRELFESRSDAELTEHISGILGKLNPTITILDNNVRTQGSK